MGWNGGRSLKKPWGIEEERNDETQTGHDRRNPEKGFYSRDRDGFLSTVSKSSRASDNSDAEFLKRSMFFRLLSLQLMTSLSPVITNWLSSLIVRFLSFFPLQKHRHQSEISPTVNCPLLVHSLKLVIFFQAAALLFRVDNSQRLPRYNARFSSSNIPRSVSPLSVCLRPSSSTYPYASRSTNIADNTRCAYSPTNLECNSRDSFHSHDNLCLKPRSTRRFGAMGEWSTTLTKKNTSTIPTYHSILQCYHVKVISSYMCSLPFLSTYFTLITQTYCAWRKKDGVVSQGVSPCISRQSLTSLHYSVDA